MWTEKMVKELKKIYGKHRAERDILGGAPEFSSSTGRSFSLAKAVVHLKKKFPDLRENEGFHAICVRSKVHYLGLRKL